MFFKIQTIIDEGDIFSCEVYTTKVAQHYVKILAELSNNTIDFN